VLVILTKINKEVTERAIFCLRSKQGQLVVKGYLDVLHFVKQPSSRCQDEKIRILIRVRFFINVSSEQRCYISIHIIAESVKLLLNFLNHLVILVDLHINIFDEVTLLYNFDVECLSGCGQQSLFLGQFLYFILDSVDLFPHDDQLLEKGKIFYYLLRYE
jgi:hypothetical protein